MDDIFGNRPPRPDHPDFELIREVMRRYDDMLKKVPGEEQGAAWKLAAAEHVDANSLMYAATVRTLLVLDIKTVDELHRQSRTEAGRWQASRLACMFLDGFMVGAAFAKARQKTDGD